GFLNLKDTETGESRWINTSSKKLRKNYRINSLKEEDEIQEILRKSGVDYTTVKTDESYIKPLIDLFKKR
ncbi:MAG: DUF58 domain-containing protein, partial [Flavobacteriales bacterium]